MVAAARIMEDVEKDRAALLGTIDQLSDKDLEWLAALATGLVRRQRKRDAFAAFLAGGSTTDAMYEMVTGGAT
ncbi:hypothetical protein EGT07_18245 [Herbaspirillum sp. HC18]|nr:hypothetical protein EGT07_18245 [Herbaspirillum sp. HC18]